MPDALYVTLRCAVLENFEVLAGSSSVPSVSALMRLHRGFVRPAPSPSATAADNSA